jgi:transposase
MTDRAGYFSHERLLQRLEIEGTRRCRSGDATQRGREDFGVSIATIGRYLRRSREGVDLAPRPSTDRTPTILANLQHKRALWNQLEKNDTATLERHCELWEETQGV